MAKLAQIRMLTFNNEEIGMGFNSQSGLAIGSALEGFTVRENPTAAGMQVRSSISVVTSHENLQESLDMSFEAEGRYGCISGGAKAKFSEQTNYNSESTFIVASVLAQNPLIRGAGFQVTGAAKELLHPPVDPATFKTAFGDSFVRGLQTGGEFYAVIRITSVSTSKQSELSASLHAEMNGLAAGGAFKAQFDEANHHDSSKTEYTATMYQNSGNGPEISPTVAIEEVMTRFKAFPAIASAHPGAYLTEVATYDTIPLPLPTPDEEDAFLFALNDARTKKLEYIQQRNDLDFALNNPSFFQGLPGADVLTGNMAVYTSLINAVFNHAIRLSHGEVNPPEIFDASKLTPPIQIPVPIQLVRIKNDPDLIAVPDFDGCTSWAECVILAANKHMLISEVQSYKENIVFQVLRTVPATNDSIPSTKTISIYTQGNGPSYLRAAQADWRAQQQARGGAGLHF